MGASLGGDGIMAEMNLTPLIDIVLVVLIIMMVNMPVEVQRMGAKLPKPPDGTPPPATEIDQLAVALYQDGTLALNRRVMSEGTLAYQLGIHLRPMDEKKVFIDAHREVPYTRVVDMMDIIQTAGGGVLTDEDGNELLPVAIGFAKLKDEGPLAPNSVDQGGMPRGVHPGSPVTKGSRNESQADAAFQPMKGLINGCYMTALGRDPALTGGLALRIVVAPNGSLMGVEIASSSHGDPELNECMRQVGEQFTFPPKDAETTAIVQYPLLLSPG